MPKLIAQCPSCEGRVSVIKLACEQCSTSFEGRFPIPAFLRLPEDDQYFILEFVRVSGSLKEMAKRLEVSYPTVRNRLDELIERLQGLAKDIKPSKDAILDALEKGDIPVQEAVRRLRAYD